MIKGVTQEEKELPAKVYQLEAIEAQVQSIGKQMTEGFDRLNFSVNTLITKSENQVTPQQLESNISALRVVFEDKLEEQVEKLHLEYGPLKENNKWFIRAMASQAIIIVGQVIFILYITGAAK